MPYEISFYTGNESKLKANAIIYLQLYGNKGAKESEILLFQSDGRIFGPGAVDKFNVSQ